MSLEVRIVVEIPDADDPPSYQSVQHIPFPNGAAIEITLVAEDGTVTGYGPFDISDLALTYTGVSPTPTPAP